MKTNVQKSSSTSVALMLTVAICFFFFFCSRRNGIKTYTASVELSNVVYGLSTPNYFITIHFRRFARFTTVRWDMLIKLD